MTYPAFKLVFMGDSSVGKTTLSKRMNHQPITPYESSTVGCAFTTYTFSDPAIDPPNKFRLNMWDTAGQERYFSLVDIYLKNCQIAIFVYDLTRPDTLASLFERWLPQFLECRYNAEWDLMKSVRERKKIIYFVGNKADKIEKEHENISALFRKHHQLLADYHIRQFQVSALHNQQIEAFLSNLYQVVLEELIPALEELHPPKSSRSMLTDINDNSGVILPKCCFS